MTERISILRVEESARFNPDRLEALCREIGEIEAEREVAIGLEQITMALAQLPRLRDAGDVLQMEVVLGDLAHMAGRIGMESLGRVAQDVLRTLARGDVPAFGATFARLERVGERSVRAVWDIEDARP